VESIKADGRRSTLHKSLHSIMIILLVLPLKLHALHLKLTVLT
jgi:hypothetical protein